MATKKQILESNELLQQKRKAYHLSDEGFEEYKKFLSDPDQKKFCFKGYYYVEVKRPYFVGFGRQNSTTILHRILINAYICIHS